MIHLIFLTCASRLIWAGMSGGREGGSNQIFHFPVQSKIFCRNNIFHLKMRLLSMRHHGCHMDAHRTLVRGRQMCFDQNCETKAGLPCRAGMCWWIWRWSSDPGTRPPIREHGRLGQVKIQHNNKNIQQIQNTFKEDILSVYNEIIAE